MKTLDEVIKAEEICSQIDADCSICPYKATAKGWCEEKDLDALHYLKEYKKDREDPDGHHQQLEKAQKLLWEFYQNEPLTWQELKGLEGKPVFVEERYRNGDLKSSGWCLIDFWNDDQICMRDQGGNPWNEHRSNYGRDWQAYRKERK